MKTVKRGHLVRRAGDSLARELVKNHNYSYCPKHVFKEAAQIKSNIHREIKED